MIFEPICHTSLPQYFLRNKQMLQRACSRLKKQKTAKAGEKFVNVHSLAHLRLHKLVAIESKKVANHPVYFLNVLLGA